MAKIVDPDALAQGVEVVISTGAKTVQLLVAGDLNNDCNINFEDFCIMALHWMEEHG